MAQTVVPGLERRLKAHLLGEVEFDAFTRGRYATDASQYQIMPLGVVAPRSVKEAEHALAIAREEGVSVLARGAGTSQSGQAVNSSLVILQLGAREGNDIEARSPKLQRRVGGYHLDSLLPGRNEFNLAHILVGSEGTLAFSTRIELKLSPLLGARAVGACHFGSFFQAMEAAQHIVKLAPIAVELVDRTMLGLARDIAMFRSTIEAVVRGDPEAVLVVE